MPGSATQAAERILLRCLGRRARQNGPGILTHTYSLTTLA